MLNTVIHGDATALPPLLIAHGLFGSARNWGVIAKRLSQDRQVICVDMRNHGSSPQFDTHSYHDLADDLAQVLDEPCDVLGHSMGGKAAMVLALTRPEKVNRLIVADIAPVAYSHTHMGPIEAMRNVDMSRVERPGVDTFLLQSLDLKTKSWRFNLDTLANEMDRIIGFPQIGGQFEGPAFFLSGANSDYVKRARRGPLVTRRKAARIRGGGCGLFERVTLC